MSTANLSDNGHAPKLTDMIGMESHNKISYWWKKAHLQFGQGITKKTRLKQDLTATFFLTSELQFADKITTAHYSEQAISTMKNGGSSIML